MQVGQGLGHAAANMDRVHPETFPNVPENRARLSRDGNHVFILYIFSQLWLRLLKTIFSILMLRDL